jgi:hypothetical protein
LFLFITIFDFLPGTRLGAVLKKRFLKILLTKKFCAILSTKQLMQRGRAGDASRRFGAQARAL